MINILSRNKYAVGFLIVVGMIISALGVYAYFSNEPPAQDELVTYTGRANNVSTSSLNDETNLFTFNVAGSDKKFFYRSFYPNFDSVLNVMTTNPNVTVWVENTNSNTPNVWVIDVAGSGPLVTYDQMVEARESNAFIGLLVGGAMALVTIGLMIHFLRMD